METVWLVIGAVAVAAPSMAQDRATVGAFTKSPTEHIINRLKQPFEVRSIKGIVIWKGSADPLANVLFEIQGPGADIKIRRGKTDLRGRFRIRHAPTGTYRFKATLNGFQSVMGTITITRKASSDNEIKIEMPVGV